MELLSIHPAVGEYHLIKVTVEISIYRSVEISVTRVWSLHMGFNLSNKKTVSATIFTTGKNLILLIKRHVTTAPFCCLIVSAQRHL